MTQVMEQSNWKKSSAAVSQLRLAEKFRLQGKTDELNRYTSLPKIRKRMLGGAESYDLLDKQRKQEQLEIAREKLNVTKKKWDRNLKKPESKFQSIENALSPQKVKFKGGFVDTYKSSNTDELNPQLQKKETKLKRGEMYSDEQWQETLQESSKYDINLPEHKTKVFDKQEEYKDFRDSEYYKQKKHLRGFLGPAELQKMKQRIKQKGPHNRRLYDLSPTLEKRREQVNQMVEGMEDSIEATRVEQLIVQRSISEMPNFYYFKSKLDNKGTQRVNWLTQDRFEA